MARASQDHEYITNSSTSGLSSLIDEHLAWQRRQQERAESLRSKDSRGTLMVDWDGYGDPMISYRSTDGEEDEAALWLEEPDVLMPILPLNIRRHRDKHEDEGKQASLSKVSVASREKSLPPLPQARGRIAPHENIERKNDNRIDTANSRSPQRHKINAQNTAGRNVPINKTRSHTNTAVPIPPKRINPAPSHTPSLPHYKNRTIPPYQNTSTKHNSNTNRLYTTATSSRATPLPTTKGLPQSLNPPHPSYTPISKPEQKRTNQASLQTPISKTPTVKRSNPALASSPPPPRYTRPVSPDLYLSYTDLVSTPVTTTTSSSRPFYPTHPHSHTYNTMPASPKIHTPYSRDLDHRFNTTRRNVPLGQVISGSNTRGGGSGGRERGRGKKGREKGGLSRFVGKAREMFRGFVG